MLCAANQIGKSSVAIRRNICDATEPERWKSLWGLDKPPGMFWYFYPDQGTVNREFETKWLEWLPNGAGERDRQCGWKAIGGNRSRDISGIKFNSGVSLYFLTYTKRAASLQASTVHQVTADEELPLHLYDELILRLTRTKGVFNSVFTPTLNQAFWQEVFETNRRLPLAYKRMVSMYDCLQYEDGTPSEFFTLDTIRDIESKCKSQEEIDRRVHGKFVKEGGRRFSGFSVLDNVKDRTPIPDDWSYYAGIDPGSGGLTGHPAAVVICALSPDCRRGAVVDCWRGDDVETASKDILDAYIKLKGNRHITLAVYDWQAKDFEITSSRLGYGFVKANKARELGIDTLNMLFKARVLDVQRDVGDDGEMEKLITELNLARANKGAMFAKKKDDDLMDALRYCVMAMPWDLTGVKMLEDLDNPQPKPKVEALPKTALS